MIRSQICWCVLITWFCCGMAWGAAKTPVPDAAEQKPAIVTVKEIFKSELASAKSSAQFADIAERMLGNLQRDESSAVNDYVLLTQGHGLAVKALYPTLSLRIVQMISDKYAVDQHTLTVQTLPFADLVPLTEALKPRRWRPIRVRPYPTPEGLKVAAIWLYSSVEGELFDGTTEEIEKHDADNRAKGFTAVDLAGYLDANKQVRHILASAKVKWEAGTNIDITVQKLIDGTPFKTPVEKGCATQTRQQYYDAEGKLFNDVVWRQRRQLPLHFGVAQQLEIIPATGAAQRPTGVARKSLVGDARHTAIHRCRGLRRGR